MSICHLSSGDLCALQECLHVRTRQDGLGLLEGFDFLIAGSLADVEVLQDVVAACVELAVVGRELIQVGHDRCVLGLCLHKVILGLCLGLGLVGHVLALGLNGSVGLLDECLVCCLGAALCLDCLGLHG